MDIATYKNDFWGREVLLGVSWELLWLVCVVALVIVAVHAIFMATQQKSERPSKEGIRVQRHEPVDRIMHWVMAISVLVLLFTGVLPIIGIEFAWLALHWISGLVLTAAVLFHIIRSVMRKDLRSVWISASDLKEPFDEGHKPGKYSVAQKGMHAAITVVTLLVIISGLVMFAMIDTPWWERTNSLSEFRAWMDVFRAWTEYPGIDRTDRISPVLHIEARETVLPEIDDPGLDIRRRILCES